MRLTAVILSLACALSLFAQKSTEWDRLLAGNGAFQGNSITFGGLIQERSNLVGGQRPPVVVLSCSDSRVPPELVFRQTLGQIFLVRSAGNVTDTDGLASIEYALTRPPSTGWITRLLVILAHEKCGAVKFAMGSRPNPADPDNRNLVPLYDRIHASFTVRCPNPGDENGCWTFHAKQNALHVVTDLQDKSPIIRRAIASGLPVAVAYYRLNGTLEILRVPLARQ
jgi:carbonic anhydrase